MKKDVDKNNEKINQNGYVGSFSFEGYEYSIIDKKHKLFKSYLDKVINLGKNYCSNKTNKKKKRLLKLLDNLRKLEQDEERFMLIIHHSIRDMPLDFFYRFEEGRRVWYVEYRRLAEIVQSEINDLVRQYEEKMGLKLIPKTLNK